MELNASFKVPTPLPPGLTLRRVSWLRRTVQYAWPCSHCGMEHTCAPFDATAQEWERACD